MIRDFLRNYKQNNVGRLRYHSTNTVTEPITLNEAKAQLRIDLSFTDDDTYINTLIAVARSACENYLGYMLARNSKMNFYLDQFPDESVIHLNGVWNPGAVAISYYDTTDTQVIWASGYNVDIHSQPARIFLSDSTSYPDTSDNIPSGINIDMTNCGPVAADIPKAIHQSMLLVIGRYYELRQDVVTGTIATEIPKMTEHLLNPYRVVGC